MTKAPGTVHHDPGPPPLLGTPADAQYKAEFLDVARLQSFMSPQRRDDHQYFAWRPWEQSARFQRRHRARAQSRERPSLRAERDEPR